MMKIIVLSILTMSTLSYAEDFNGKFLITARSGLIIRTEPKQQSLSKGVIPYGSIVLVYEFSSDVDCVRNVSAKWAKVTYNGIEGWIFSYYMDSIEKYYLFEDRKFPKDFKGGTFGGWENSCSDKLKPDGTCEFYGGYSAVTHWGIWENKESFLEITLFVEESIDRDLFFCQGEENESECLSKVHDFWEKNYGKFKAEMSVKIILRISERGTIISTATGQDPEPIKGKKTIRYHEEFVYKDIGFMEK